MSALYKDRAAAEMAAEQLKVYAQPQRLMILSCLLGGERTVSKIDAATGIGQPALSQQLAELRRKDLVSTRRQGTQIFYALINEKVELCVSCMEAILGDGELPQVALRTSTQTALPAPVGAAAFAQILP